MREIVHNCDKLIESDVNRIVKRAKIILIDDNSEILLCNSNDNYFLLGGHVENNESDIDCLQRELKEEAGIDIELLPIKLFLTIRYFSKDYPNVGINTESIANYYYLKSNILPMLNEINLTSEEKAGNFRIEKIPLKDILDVLNKSLNEAKRKVVVEDTIEAIKEFMNIY